MRPKLAEDLKKLLPEESSKRIRQAIMRAASEGNVSAARVRNEIAQDNRLRTGLINSGDLTFPNTTSAILSQFVWVIEYTIFQPAASTITVLAPHVTAARIDAFTGNASGAIVYRPGTIDPFGNARFPVIPAEEVLLITVLRRFDGTTAITQVDPSVPVLSHDLLRDIHGGIPATADQPAQHNHLTDAELLKLQEMPDPATGFLDTNAVHYDRDDAKTELEKAQARDNIDVFSRDQVKEITGELPDLNTADKTNLVSAINQKGQYRSAGW